MTPPLIAPPATLALLGGGQLGRFFVHAAHELGYKVIVLDPDSDAPAGKIADGHIVASYDDQTALTQLSQRCAAATTEFENVPSAVLEQLAQTMPVSPSADAVSIAQDRIREKTFLRDNGFNTARFIPVENESELDGASNELFPAILKTARFGYDGKGQARVSSIEEAKIAYRNFNIPCVLERMLSLDLEVSVVLARGADGQCFCFPLAENDHSDGILDVTIVPARTTPALQQQAEQMASDLASLLDYIGVLTVEFFISEGQLLINEIAPRPHNSGHYTLDGCITSQYEQQLRALCGLPLGAATLHSHSVMVNLLGDLWFQQGDDSCEPNWLLLNQVPSLKLHLYSKTSARPGRKMGHFTVINQDAETAVATAMAARKAIGIQ
ncbi:MAG: 5-(carboxyamino)imidazole ribonucleotide synthase [Gammaproteobacteria bacterium]|nr:5-(carboxyamino)imidazole ribonucleotide synthase [Gammaproteobacteria bacterium]